jgi:hypothetical protein
MEPLVGAGVFDTQEAVFDHYEEDVLYDSIIILKLL